MAFISFEGPDGGGKTTQIELLAERLLAEGHEILTTREPGGTPLGIRLRTILLDAPEPLSAEAEAYLMTADRAEHVWQVIRPALARGAVVISDRYLDSTLAYQGGGRGLPIDELRSMQSLATNGLMPDLTLLLDLPVETGLERKMRAYEENRLDRESLAFHSRVADMFRFLAASEPGRWKVVDATRPATLVHTAIWLHVSAHLEACRAALVRGEIE